MTDTCRLGAAAPGPVRLHVLDVQEVADFVVTADDLGHAEGDAARLPRGETQLGALKSVTTSPTITARADWIAPDALGHSGTYVHSAATGEGEMVSATIATSDASPTGMSRRTM